MSKHETHIGSVDHSTFTIGDHSTAVSYHGSAGQADLAEALSELLGLVSRYPGPAADDVLALGVDARRELTAGTPQRGTFRRVVDAARKLMGALGSAAAQANALADAITKVSDLVRHL